MFKSEHVMQSVRGPAVHDVCTRQQKHLRFLRVLQSLLLPGQGCEGVGGSGAGLETGLLAAGVQRGYQLLVGAGAKKSRFRLCSALATAKRRN